MGSMIDHNQEHGQEENGNDITDDNFAMEIVLSPRHFVLKVHY